MDENELVGELKNLKAVGEGYNAIVLYTGEKDSTLFYNPLEKVQIKDTRIYAG